MSKRALIVGFFVLLFVLHQDSWWKEDARLVLGFLPISLAYHLVWTLLVALGWLFVARHLWPDHLDAETPPPGAPVPPPVPGERPPR